MAKRMAGKRPESFREMALERLRTCMHIGRLCEELGVCPCTLKRWRRQMDSRREAAPDTVQLPGEPLEQENRRLKQALAEKILEVDFLQAALLRVEVRRRQNIASGARPSTPRSGQ